MKKTIKHFQQKGSHHVGLKFMQTSEDFLKEHYIDLKDHPFSAGLMKHTRTGLGIVMMWERLCVVKTNQVMFQETQLHTPKHPWACLHLCWAENYSW